MQEPAAILVIDTGSRTVNDPAVVAEAAALEAKVKSVSNVDRTLSYWTTGGAPSMKAADDKAAFLFIFSSPDSNDWAALEKIGKEVQEKFDGEQGNFTVYASGAGVITNAINSKIKEDLLLAEAIAILSYFYSADFCLRRHGCIRNATRSWCQCNPWIILHYFSLHAFYRCICLCTQSDYRFGIGTWNRLRTAHR